MRTITVKAPSSEYGAVIDDSYGRLAETLQAAGLCSGSAAVVTDDNVRELYAAHVMGILGGIYGKLSLLSLKPGERHKTQASVNEIYSRLAENRHDRRTVLFALGGGVVGDLSGFAAATYMRGLPLVILPTTLTAQCDSAIGGKTGYDFNGVKNAVGVFKQPALTYINTEVLRTLDGLQYASGLCELIKYGIACDGNFFDYLSRVRASLLLRGRNELSEAVFRACSIKAGIVARDEFDMGERAVLNFGHTIGHALESASGFSLSHGEAVALGMRAALYIGAKRRLTPPAFRREAEALIESFGLPGRLPGLADIQKIVAFAENDKKFVNGRLRFVFAAGKGKALVDICEKSEIIEAVVYINN
jgi:3-dehydroquinate synthase